MATGEKAPDAFRTIGELSAELGVAQHILRYWETKFPQLRPLQRAGNRRYYRPADVALARRIHRLLNEEGYTVKGVQKLLRSKDEPAIEPLVVKAANVVPEPEYGVDTPIPAEQGRIDIERLKFVRDHLAAALQD
ncbi:MAG TPA: MerR family transcriptional regulator [Sphingomicrobium sp.]|nr:MerR family transcriptional regulator [Sphingomicrobium sp.]